MRTRSGSDYQTSDCQTSTPEENPTTAPEVNRSAMAMDAFDAAITPLNIDGPATNESLAQMLRGLAQTLTKSFGNIIAKKDAEIGPTRVKGESDCFGGEDPRPGTVPATEHGPNSRHPGGPERGHRRPRQRRRREKAGRPVDEARFRTVASSRSKERGEG